MSYLYKRHTGGFYTSDIDYTYDDLYCATCGDCDHYIGQFDSEREFLELILPHCSIDGSGGFALNYVFPKFVSEFRLNIDVPYSSKYDKDCGFCALSEKEILCKFSDILGMTYEDFIIWVDDLYRAQWGYSINEEDDGDNI